MKRIALLIPLLGCTPSRSDPGPALTDAQSQELRVAERLFRSRSPQWPETRDRLLREPATRVWLSRMLIAYAVESRRDEAPEGEELLKEMALIDRDTYFARALREFRDIGAPAVTPVYQDLISSKLPENRIVGSLIMAAIGEPAVPQLMAGAEAGPHRRACIQALGSFAARPEVAALLRKLAADPGWELRGEAVAALGGAVDPGSFAVLEKTALREEDGFVRRKAVEALSARPEPRAVPVLVEALDAAVRAQQLVDAKAAHAALRRATGEDFGWDVNKWRGFLAEPGRSATRPLLR
jgi:HEAT repeat protein